MILQEVLQRRKETQQEAIEALRGFWYEYDRVVAGHRGTQFSKRWLFIGRVSNWRFNRRTLTAGIWVEKRSKGSGGRVERIRVEIQKHGNDQQFLSSSVF